MESLVSALILGFVQGLTEFLPVSSSGHLILAREFLGLENGGLSVDILLHFATALAVILYFRKDLIELLTSSIAWLQGKAIEQSQKVLLVALIIGTIPAVVLGVMFEGFIEATFRSAEFVAYILLLGSGLFIVAEFFAKRIVEKKSLTIQKGVAIGFFQALALLPGMSRSGATISGGLLLGLSREQAARFAFLLSIPIILGAGSKKALELTSSGALGDEWLFLVVACTAAFLSGLFAIHFLMQFLRTHTLMVFVVYRVLLALVILLLL